MLIRFSIFLSYPCDVVEETTFTCLPRRRVSYQRYISTPINHMEHSMLVQRRRAKFWIFGKFIGILNLKLTMSYENR